MKNGMLLRKMAGSRYPAKLPPLWQLILDEALQGNHLLFRGLSLEHYERSLQVDDFFVDPCTADFLENIIMTLAQSATLSEMQRIIANLSDEIRRPLYLIYRRAIDVWCLQEREALH